MKNEQPQKIFQVCNQSKCKNKPFEAEIKKRKVLFCCKAGFEKSLSDFLKNIKP